MSSNATRAAAQLNGTTQTQHAALQSETAISAEPETDAEPDKPSGRSFEDGPWAIKFIAGTDKELAYRAAKRAKLTIGEWLSRAIRAAVEDERESVDQYDVLAPGQTLSMIDPLPSLSIDEIGRAVEIAQQIAQLRARKPSATFLNLAQRKLVQRLIGGAAS